MPRLKKTDKGRRVELWLPQSILAKVQLELFSEIEGRIPYGKMSELGTNLFSEWLKSRGIVV